MSPRKILPPGSFKVEEGTPYTDDDFSPGDLSLREAVQTANSSQSGPGLYKSTDGGRVWYVVGLLFLVGLVILLVFALPRDLSAPDPSSAAKEADPTKPPPTSSGPSITWNHYWVFAATTNVEYTLRVVDTAPMTCIDDLTAVLPTACIVNTGNQAIGIEDILIAIGDQYCQTAAVAMGGEGNDWLLGGTVEEYGGGWGNDLLSADDIMVDQNTSNAEPPTEEVAIVFHNITWVVEPQADRLPIIVVPLDPAPANAADQKIRTQNFYVEVAGVHADPYPFAFQYNPETLDDGPPLLVLTSDQPGPSNAINGSSLNTAEIDFVEVGGGDTAAQDSHVLAILMLVPADQVFPQVLPPLCEAVSLPPPVETEEPPDSSVPVSTEEPVDRPPSVCGDLVCDPNTENTDLCPTDCQCVDDGVCRPGEGESCQDCGASAGFCGATCADSSQCAAGLACAGGVCWDALTCGSDPGGGSGGGGDDDSCGYGKCGCKADVSNQEVEACIFIFYDSCGNTQKRNVCNNN